MLKLVLAMILCSLVTSHKTVPLYDLLGTENVDSISMFKRVSSLNISEMHDYMNKQIWHNKKRIWCYIAYDSVSYM